MSGLSTTRMVPCRYRSRMDAFMVLMHTYHRIDKCREWIVNIREREKVPTARWKRGNRKDVFFVEGREERGGGGGEGLATKKKKLLFLKL